MVATPAWTQNGRSRNIEINSVSPIRNPVRGLATGAGELPDTPLFGTDGIRGRVGDLLNAPLALQVGFWAGQILSQQSGHCGPVILGQDTRTSGNMLAMALSAGLTAAGLEVWHIGVCPTPGVAYLTDITEAVGGIMISASHNPPEDNGIKFFGENGTKLSPQLQRQIEAGIRGQADYPVSFNQCGQHHYRPEFVKQYAESLSQPLLATQNFQGMRIVLDLAYGAAVALAETVFRQMGAEVICLNAQANGEKINVNCGSTHLQGLQQAVVEMSADMGFAFDGDADRVLAVDSEGRAIDGDYILYFWGKTLSQAGKLPNNLIISTVMANLGFEQAWKQFGGQLHRTKVGDQHVHAAMKKMGAMLGGEQSGHILCHHYGMSGDGLLTALHLASLVQQSGQPLSELVDNSFQTYPQLLKNVRVEDVNLRRNWKNCDRLVQAIAEAESDMGDRGRVLVRASGTEPVVRVMVEAIDTKLAHRWTDYLVTAVQQYLV
ncbi:MAG: phosphoglucosamine mutase [Microcoleaceae cyanobacterium]